MLPGKKERGAPATIAPHENCVLQQMGQIVDFHSTPARFPLPIPREKDPLGIVTSVRRIVSAQLVYVPLSPEVDVASERCLHCQLVDLVQLAGFENEQCGQWDLSPGIGVESEGFLYNSLVAVLQNGLTDCCFAHSSDCQQSLEAAIYPTG